MKWIRQGKRNTRAGCALLGLSWALCVGAAAQTIDLYVDRDTGQVFGAPGENRDRLGTFERVGETEPAPAAPAATSSPVASDSESDDFAIAAAVERVLQGKWYERIKLRGYTQFRYTALIDKEGEGEWFHPADRSVAEDTSFLIRRGRLVFSGDVTDRLSVYVQPDLMAAVGDGDFSLQLRDLYTDVAFDRAREFRVRIGQSKVPFGFANLQSSQNRIALERADAINSAVEGERDIGIQAMWAPAAKRTLFRDLVRRGLKGTGDYGVLALGVYNGQGPNRLDFNDGVHVAARASCPLELPGGQIVEPGIQGYWGRFVPRVAAIPLDGEQVTPAFPDNGVDDARGGISFVLYPQPFGIEAEWNFGEGPTLDDDFARIRSRFLHGGYVQGTYRIQFAYGELFPMVRWQYYDGGRKFARNAPDVRVNELDIGFEWSPIPELELAAIYSYTPYRTDSSRAPYEDFENASRVGMQVQWNY